MKLLIISDIKDENNIVEQIPKADLLISCGDVSDAIILKIAKLCCCEKIFAVKGDKDKKEPFTHPIIDLHLNSYHFNDYTFGGFQGAIHNNPKARNFLYEDYEVYIGLMEQIKLDFFITHNSPFGIHDKDYGEHNGFSSFNYYIETYKPKYMFHGHQCMNSETRLNETEVIGVAGYKEIVISKAQIISLLLLKSDIKKYPVLKL